MRPLTLLHDETFDGLLHAIAAAVKSENQVEEIRPVSHFSPTLFVEPVHLKADPDQAHKLFRYLHSLGPTAVRYTYNGYLSEDPAVATHLYRMVLLSLKQGAQASKLYTNDSIRYLDRLSSRVTLEAHRFQGLIRFRILENGLQYAPFEPDHNLIGYCAGHFSRRLKNQRWILHDLRRNYALYWNKHSLQDIEIDSTFTSHVRKHGEIPDSWLTPAEETYQNLWSVFHQAITNRQRENLPLQRQFMPRRYWRYLPEMQQLCQPAT